MLGSRRKLICQINDLLWIALLSLFKGNEPWFWKVLSQSCQFLSSLRSHCGRIYIFFLYRLISMRCIIMSKKRNLLSFPTSTTGLLRDLGQNTYPLWTAIPPSENWGWYYIFKDLSDPGWKTLDIMIIIIFHCWHLLLSMYFTVTAITVCIFL